MRLIEPGRAHAPPAQKTSVANPTPG